VNRWVNGDRWFVDARVPKDEGVTLAATEESVGSAGSERLPAGDPPRDSLTGAGLVLVSCLGGGAVVVLARLAYESGSNAPTSLLVRFALAGGLLWAVLAAGGQPTRLPARVVRRFVLMGCLFTAPATSAFMAIERIPASLATLIYYSYPAIATVASALLFGTRLSVARGLVLLAALGGVALTVDVGSGSLDRAGLALAFGSAVSTPAIW
jgi:drug/metabolite transporter (DMT)-like permease